MKKIVLVIALIIFSFGLKNEAFAVEYAFSAIDAYNQGVSQYNSKAYNSAISSFEKAVQIEPKFVDAYYNLASIYVYLKQYDKAITAYSNALKINPNDTETILELAKICFLRKNYSTAVKYLSYVPQSAPNYKQVEKMITDARKLAALEQEKAQRMSVKKANQNKKIIIDKFSSPTGLATDSKGNLYVACYSDNSIMRVENSNSRTTLFSRSPLIKGPIGLAVDKFDNLYVANYGADNILKISPKGEISVFMNKVYKPYCLYIISDVLFISEQSNNIVIKYNLRNIN